MESRVLGSLEVVDQDGLLALGAPQQRALLAMLLVHRGETVFPERLTDELWVISRPVWTLLLDQLWMKRHANRRAATRQPGVGRSRLLAATDSIHVRHSTHSARVQ